MPFIGNSSGYGELIFLLLIIVFQLIATILQKLNQKKSPSYSDSRRDLKPESQSPASSRRTSSQPKEPPKIEEELRELLEALGMEPPQTIEKNPAPAVTTPKPSPQPVAVSPQKAPSPDSFQVKVTPQKEMAPATVPTPLRKQDSIEEEIKFNVAPLLESSSTTTARNVGVPTSSYADLKTLLKSRDEARRGILIAEILGKPLSLR